MIKIICFGKIKEDYLKELINDYVKRISKYSKLEIIELKDDPNQVNETKSILNVIKRNEYNVYLDIRGKLLDSVQFADMIDKTLIKYPSVTFIIGSSVGLADEVIKLCNDRISFSSMTMPHGLFRGVLLEQIYRACKINNNESYHK